jgi:hypothetical protein
VPAPAGALATAAAPGRSAGRADPAAVPVDVPHSEQNLAPTAKPAPQFAHTWLSVDPHSEQNFADAPLAVPQFEQTMGSGRASLGGAIRDLPRLFRAA